MARDHRELARTAIMRRGRARRIGAPWAVAVELLDR
jgi:hypothetical protein